MAEQETMRTISQLVHVDKSIKGRAAIVFLARRQLKETAQRFRRALPKCDHRSSRFKVNAIIKNPVSGGHYVKFCWTLQDADFKDS